MAHNPPGQGYLCHFFLSISQCHECLIPLFKRGLSLKFSIPCFITSLFAFKIFQELIEILFYVFPPPVHSLSKQGSGGNLGRFGKREETADPEPVQRQVRMTTQVNGSSQ